MISVEDVVERLALRVEADTTSLLVIDQLSEPFYTQFLWSVAQATRKGRALSTRQSRTALRICRYARDYLVEHGIYPADEYDAFLKTPHHRQIPYLSADYPREVRHLGWGRVAFRFRMDEAIRAEIRSLRGRPYEQDGDEPPYFDRSSRLWIVEVTGRNVDRVIDVVNRYGFDFDDEFVRFLTDVTNERDRRSRFSLDEDSDSIVIEARASFLVAHWASLVLQADEP